MLSELSATSVLKDESWLSAIACLNSATERASLSCQSWDASRNCWNWLTIAEIAKPGEGVACVPSMEAGGSEMTGPWLV